MSCRFKDDWVTFKMLPCSPWLCAAWAASYSQPGSFRRHPRSCGWRPWRPRCCCGRSHQAEVSEDTHPASAGSSEAHAPELQKRQETLLKLFCFEFNFIFSMDHLLLTASSCHSSSRGLLLQLLHPYADQPHGGSISSRDKPYVHSKYRKQTSTPLQSNTIIY